MDLFYIGKGNHAKTKYLDSPTHNEERLASPLENTRSIAKLVDGVGGKSMIVKEFVLYVQSAPYVNWRSQTIRARLLVCSSRTRPCNF